MASATYTQVPHHHSHTHPEAIYHTATPSYTWHSSLSVTHRIPRAWGGPCPRSYRWNFSNDTAPEAIAAAAGDPNLFTGQVGAEAQLRKGAAQTQQQGHGRAVGACLPPGQEAAKSPGLARYPHLVPGLDPASRKIWEIFLFPLLPPYSAGARKQSGETEGASHTPSGARLPLIWVLSPSPLPPAFTPTIRQLSSSSSNTTSPLPSQRVRSSSKQPPLSLPSPPLPLPLSFSASLTYTHSTRCSHLFPLAFSGNFCPPISTCLKSGREKWVPVPVPTCVPVAPRSQVRLGELTTVRALPPRAVRVVRGSAVKPCSAQEGFRHTSEVPG